MCSVGFFFFKKKYSYDIVYMRLSGVENFQVLNPVALYMDYLQQFKWNNIFRKMKDNRK